MRWLMIGTAPSVLRTLPKLRELLEFDRIITCNGGIRLEPNPDYYACCDMVASVAYEAEARAAQSNGTKLLTMKRDERAMRDRRVDFYDEFLVLAKHNPPTRQQMGRFRYTGPMCLEYACHHGATEVHMVGVDGYRYSGDYFTALPGKQGNGRNAKREGTQRTMDVLRPACREIAAVWSDVQFVQHGDPVPCFQVGEPNWRVCRC